jgi:hypothetical protein
VSERSLFGQASSPVLRVILQKKNRRLRRKRVERRISLGCVNGEGAPFVGHNAFLRWSAVQDASFLDAVDPDPFDREGKLRKRKQWSEANVSEDFDLALRLLKGLHVEKGYLFEWRVLGGCEFDGGG